MAKFRIESQITLLAVIIAAAVVTSGYFAWKSLSNIVSSIHEEARPDNRLFLLKGISNDLSAIENNARLYMLTNNLIILDNYDSLQTDITGKLQSLYEVTPPASDERNLVDSFRLMAIEKVELWNEVLNLHQEMESNEDEFNEVFNKLEEQNFDTITTTTERTSIFRRLFGTEQTIVDTTIVEQNLEREELKEQIQEARSEISQREAELNLLESDLIAENIVITNEINRLIAQAEEKEERSLIEKTEEADRLATLTYKRLAGFSVMAVVLLLTVLFLLFNFVRKRRKYERGLKKARQEAENLALAKEQFAANVSHEMRTPVNSIYGLAEQLLRRKNNTSLDEQISVLAQSARHLNHIINDTLDFSKIQAGKIRFDEVHFSPQQVFDEIYALQKYSALQKGISLDLKLAENLPDALLGDPLRLKQVLINIIGNAIKFTDKGRVAIHAETTEKLKDIYKLKIRISDTGIGISEEDQKIIFDEFVQAEDGRRKKYRGTGLGLAIVKKLVELQGGSIAVDSEPGAGTTVSLLIPYPEGDFSKIETAETAPLEVPEFFSGIRVLLADDEEFNRFLFKAIFDKWSISYKEATDGEEAVEQALNEDFDIIMMDYRMPKKNGLEATKSILREKPEAKIVAITATDDETERRKCEEAGMSGFLPKPFSEEQLFALIHSTVNPERKEQSPSQPDYIAAMKKMANGDDNFLKEMMLLFTESTEATLQKTEQAINEKAWQDVSDFAHQIAPQCKQFGESGLYKDVKTLEKLAGTQPVDEQKVQRKFAEVKQTVRKINDTFSNFLEKQKV